jgi:hypothetical protein
MPPWMNTLGVPDSYFEHWAPGQGSAASQMAHGGLAALLRNRDLWIREMSDTQVNRIGEALAQALDRGETPAQAAEAVEAIVHDAARAKMIADTEYVRAMSEAALETMRANRVAGVSWLMQPGACQLCVENHAVSPQPVSDPNWPNGPLPVHPWERCAYGPAPEVPRRANAR